MNAKPEYRLTRADRERIDEECHDVWCAVFHRLDAEYGGVIAGDIAHLAERIVRRRLTKLEMVAAW